MSSPSPLALSWDTPLVGHDADMARLTALFEAPPALAVVRGEPGTGRSTLLAALREAAAAAGWSTVGPLDVRTAADREGFERALRAGSGLPNPPADGDLNPLRRDTSPAHTAVEQARTTGLPAVVLPTLVLVDDYPTDEDVEQLVTDGLGRLAASAPVVTVVAGTAPSVAPLEAGARVIVDTSVPTVTEVRTYLARLGERLDPPPSDAELDVLADGLAGAPHLIRPLVRALYYGRADG